MWFWEQTRVFGSQFQGDGLLDIKSRWAWKEETAADPEQPIFFSRRQVKWRTSMLGIAKSRENLLPFSPGLPWPTLYSRWLSRFSPSSSALSSWLLVWSCRLRAPAGQVVEGDLESVHINIYLLGFIILVRVCKMYTMVGLLLSGFAFLL